MFERKCHVLLLLEVLFQFIHILCAGGRLSGDDVHVARSFAEVFQLLLSQQVSSKLEQAFVIGGEAVYQV